jgi:hypothetical protein
MSNEPKPNQAPQQPPRENTPQPVQRPERPSPDTNRYEQRNDPAPAERRTK